jgi:sirohydrochlorin ferrochelatase
VAIRRTGRFDEVRVGCIKGCPDLAAALAGAPGPVTIVPLLMAEGFIHELMLRRLAVLPGAGVWRMAAPVGAHPGLTSLILRKAEAACGAQDWPMHRTGLLLIGHGTPRHRASADATRAEARRLGESGRFAATAAAFLEEPPLPAETAADLPGEHLVVAGLFLDNGPHGEDDVREALAPVRRPCCYTGAIGADPALVPLILDQAEAALAVAA